MSIRGADLTGTRQEYVPPIAATATSGPAKAVTHIKDIEEIVRLVVDAVSPKATATGNGDDGPPPHRSVATATAAAEESTPAVSTEQEATRGSSTGRQLYAKLGTFDGSGSWETFSVKFNICADYNKWKDPDKRIHLMSALTGPAAEIIPSCQETPTYTYLLDRLQRRYGAEHQYDSYRYQLQNRRQRSNESLQALFDDLEKLAARGYPDCTVDMRETLFTLLPFRGL